MLATLAKNNTLQGINLDSNTKTDQNLQEFDKELEELGLKNEGDSPDKLQPIDYYQEDSINQSESKNESPAKLNPIDQAK